MNHPNIDPAIRLVREAWVLRHLDGSWSAYMTAESAWAAKVPGIGKDPFPAITPEDEPIESPVRVSGITEGTVFVWQGRAVKIKP